MNQQIESNQLATSFALLSRLWLCEVDVNVLEQLNDPQVKGSFEALQGTVPPATTEMAEQLAIEYCELLIGPKGHLSPIQSVWEENKFQGESATSMHEFFKVLPGYQPPSAMVDHIGVQLDFVSHVLSAETDNSDKKEVDELTSSFYRKHFEWMHPFLDQIESRRRSSFYDGIARITRHLIMATR